jgi:AraC-like DNA-binding protein
LIVLFTTEQFDESRRFERWQETVCRAFVPFDCHRLSDRPFTGLVESSQVGDYRFSRVHCVGHQVERTPARIREATEATLLVSLQTIGTGILLQDGREAVLAPGAIAFYESVRPFTWSYKHDFEQIVLLAPRDQLIGRVGQLERFTARTIDTSSSVGGLVANFLRQAFPLIGTASPGTAERLSQISMELIATALGELSEQQPSKSWSRVTLLYRAKHLISENLRDPELSPDSVARMMRISTRYLQDLFKDENTTASCWIWTQRLAECRRRLEDPFFSGASISQIAFDCGFSDFSHFSHRFKTAFSVSPSEYRNTRKPPSSCSKRESATAHV